MLLKRLREMDAMPVGYGPAWVEPDRMIVVCAPFPLNRLLGWLHRLYWDVRLSCRPSAVERIFRAGMEHERAQSEHRDVWRQIDHEREIQAAELRGRAQVLKELETFSETTLFARRDGE
jgi:hypothetical protein